MNGETLDAATDYFQPFPDLHDVFARDDDEHSEYLLPVATVSLSHISPDWTGNVHFIIPIEPVGGYGVPGEESSRYHNYLCRPNWIGYMLRGDKCELACDFRFFHKAYYSHHPPESDLQKSEADELPKHYSEKRNHFAACEKHFQKHGWLCSDPLNWNPSKHDPEDWRKSIVRNLGGVSFEGNWSNAEDFPVSRYPDKCDDGCEAYDFDRVLPQTEDGRDFTFIGEIEMWNFIDNTNGVLLLFFDPEKRIALTTIDWT